MNSGVYRIAVGPSFYFGSSRNLRARERAHRRELEAGKHGNARLQRAFNDFHTIDFVVVQLCEPSELLQTEQTYLDEFYQDPLCLNLTASASSKGRRSLP